MADAVANVQTISVDRIFLDLANPRHKPYKTESEVIEYLCREEYVFALAKDIVKLGLNPLELFALIPLDKEKGTRRTFMVAEGNRRMCAIKLLHDPDLAPAKLRKDFAKLAQDTFEVSDVLGVEFQNKEQVDVWLERIHGGVQGGVGRKPWNSEQKTRHIGDKKNVLAQVVLDYAEQRKFISADQRKGKRLPQLCRFAKLGTTDADLARPRKKAAVLTSVSQETEALPEAAQISQTSRL